MKTMPERNLTVATYAAGASLAAITLVYVFGPTFFIDGDSSASGPGSRRKGGVVGLSNPANDCFINSILQSLAGLGDLRIYLIRELHRRRLDGREVYRVAPEDIEKLSKNAALKQEGLQRGIVTLGLKEVLDGLNERPIYKKTISASGFVEDLEYAFRQRISRQQQDAQEFLQIVAERLCDEYHAGQKARKRWKEQAKGEEKLLTNSPEEKPRTSITLEGTPLEDEAPLKDIEEEEGFPLEGKHESQVECLTCHFKPKSSISSFVTLTLNVPQRSSTTLNDCFDGLFKTEFIDDYICDRCRLEHAIDVFTAQQNQTRDEKTASKLSNSLLKLRHALNTDPEKLPPDVKMPETKSVPKRKISRHVKITSYPKVLAIHLSRSIFDPRSSSMKNSAKVSFPEQLLLGGLIPSNQRPYKLLGVVTHKGSHNSGHYESFRRQTLHPPFSTPNVFQPGGAYGQQTPITTSATPAVSPSLAPLPEKKGTLDPAATIAQSRLSTSSDTTAQTLESDHSSSPPQPKPSTVSTATTPSPTSLAPDRTSKDSTTLSVQSGETEDIAPRPVSALSGSSSKLGGGRPSSSAAHSMVELARGGARRKLGQKSAKEGRWWRISDEKAKECRTGEVLGMQKEVYLLFYELERGTGEGSGSG